jgi:hypothetical protein
MVSVVDAHKSEFSSVDFLEFQQQKFNILARLLNNSKGR